MPSQLKELFHKYFPDNKSVNTDPAFNQLWKRFLRAGYYAACLILGMTLITGLIALTMLILASALMAVYATSPGVAATLSTIMMGLVEWGPLATILTGVLLLGPWLFNKTAWLFKLIPAEESYNFADALRDTYHVISPVLSFILRPVAFLLTHIGAFFGWWDAPKKLNSITAPVIELGIFQQPPITIELYRPPSFVLRDIDMPKTEMPKNAGCVVQTFGVTRDNEKITLKSDLARDNETMTPM